MTQMVSYLIEIRKRLLRCLFIVGSVFLVFAFFANQVYHAFSLPLLHYSSNHAALIAVSVPAPFLVPLKSAFVAAIYFTAPLWLYEIWSFISPALYKNERRLGWVLLLASIILFYTGTLFAYFVVLPLVFKFLMHAAPQGVAMQPDISEYFSFVMQMLLAFGFAFEVPVFILVMVKTNLVSAQSLRQKRPYVIIGAFVLGMLLTPPDVLSQVMLAIPLWLLFEFGLWMSEYL
jgi:sec-independent protein translocase protein TatC